MVERQTQTQARRIVRDMAVQRGWTVSDLADQAGLDYGTVGDFLNGKRWPRDTTLGKLEKALGRNVGYINRLVEKLELQDVDEVTAEAVEPGRDQVQGQHEDRPDWIPSWMWEYWDVLTPDEQENAIAEALARRAAEDEEAVQQLAEFNRRRREHRA